MPLGCPPGFFPSVSIPAASHRRFFLQRDVPKLLAMGWTAELAIIVLTAVCGRPSQPIGERGRPLFPSEMPLRREADGYGEGSRLRRLGEDRPTLIARQLREPRQILRLGN